MTDTAIDTGFEKLNGVIGKTGLERGRVYIYYGYTGSGREAATKIAIANAKTLDEKALQIVVDTTDKHNNISEENCIDWLLSNTDNDEGINLIVVYARGNKIDAGSLKQLRLRMGNYSPPILLSTYETSTYTHGASAIVRFETHVLTDTAACVKLTVEKSIFAPVPKTFLVNIDKANNKIIERK